MLQPTHVWTPRPCDRYGHWSPGSPSCTSLSIPARSKPWVRVCRASLALLPQPPHQNKSSTGADVGSRGCGPWPSAITGIARRTMGTRQRARPLWLHSPRAGGANDLQARAESLRRAKDAALTFHEPVALHHAHSGGASTRRGTSPTPWGTRVGAARTIVPCLNWSQRQLCCRVS